MSSRTIFPKRRVYRAMNEHRKSPRIHTKKLAKIVFEDGRATLNCIILDTSEGGARLLIESDEELPDTFLLFRRAELTLCEATVVRRAYKTVGVRLAEPFSATSERARALKHLKDLSPVFT